MEDKVNPSGNQFGSYGVGGGGTGFTTFPLNPTIFPLMWMTSEPPRFLMPGFPM